MSSQRFSIVSSWSSGFPEKLFLTPLMDLKLHWRRQWPVNLSKVNSARGSANFTKVAIYRRAIHVLHNVWNAIAKAATPATRVRVKAATNCAKSATRSNTQSTRARPAKAATALELLERLD